MANNINQDLVLFNELVAVFLEDEIQNPVTKQITPHEVKNLLDIKLEKEGIAGGEFKKTLKEIVLNSPKSSSKLFFNQLFGGRHSKAVLGDLLAVLLNNSMATYKIAGPQVVIEQEILSKVHKLIGYDNNAGGTFPTGGSMSNFMSLIMARDKANLEIKERGICEKLVAYTSENAHYSVSKNASFSGLGRKNVRYIKSDKKGSINIIEFSKQIMRDLDQGLVPFYLNATAGTTVLCAFDNVAQLSPICKQHNIWLHLDGAFGGAVIFSDKYRRLVQGIDQTDSFCFNAHKTLGAPLSTSVLVVKDKMDLYNSFQNNASYLYQTHDQSFNLGQTSFECGRRNNALKLWTMWKSIGESGLANIVEKEFELADAARSYIKSNSDYKLYSFNDSLSVCFNYKNFDPEDLCTRLYERNILMVGFGDFQNKRFIRLVVVNCENSITELMKFFEVFEKFANQNKDLIKRN